MPTIKTRCGWVNLKNPLYIFYHDLEWGVPLYGDQKLFELLCLEGSQAGLSWETILKRRDEYRKCFYNFDPEVLVEQSDQELMERIQHFGVVKNRLKTLAIRNNALAYYRVLKDHNSFDDYIWSFVDDKPIVNVWENYADVPASTELSEQMSKSLKKYGFKFVGPVICYAFMQAAGLINDHQRDCFRCRQKLD